MPSRPLDHHERMCRAMLAFEGLSVGDCFGGRFFSPPGDSRALPEAPWPYSDDSEMALAILSILDRFGRIDPDELALDFARRYRADPYRGYGMSVRRVLDGIAEGTHWSIAAGQLFGGAGSMGNGGAMRAAPIGAYFANDYAETAKQARLSASTTHAHPEGQAGAVAVAIAAAWACRPESLAEGGQALLRIAFEYTPPGETRSGIEQACLLGLETPIPAAADRLGNGSRITSPDTVPFALWCSARHLDDFAEALWAVASAGGDNDTNAAIVGGIVALANGPGAIPEAWHASREALLTPPGRHR